MSALEMSERLDEWYIGRPQADSRGGYAVLNYPSGLFPDVDGRTFWNAYHSLQGRLANEASPVG